MLPEATMMLSFFVAGYPATKGSFKAFRNGGFVNANPRTKDWEMRVAHECQAALGDWPSCYDGAVIIECDFRLPRPKSLPKKVLHHIKKPDLDKLMRAVLDGLTGIALKDDSQVVRLIGGKRYADDQVPMGVHIEVRVP